jgi:AraC-like DNA-binding protein
VLAKPGGAAVEDWSLAANLLGTLAGSTDLEPVSRAKLLQVLGRAFAGRRSTEEMRACLERAREDSSVIVATVARMAAFRVSGVTPPPESFDEIVEGALESPDLEVRSLAVSELRFELLRTAMAAEVSLSPIYLARAFRSTVGEPPHQYAVRRRVEHARRLLAGTALSQASLTFVSTRRAQRDDG